MMKHIYILLLSGYLLLGLTACKQHSPYSDQLARIESLADVNPDSADMLLKPTPFSSQKGREYEEVCKLLRIKVDDKLYRPVTHYRDTILQLVDYFEHHPRILPSLLGSTGPALPYLYAGRIFADMGDAPQALDYYQKALDAMPKGEMEKGKWKINNEDDRRLSKQRGLLHSFIGIQFFYQGLHEEALNSFKEANRWAEQIHDTTDIIFNLRDIAEQYKYLDKNDSSLVVYKSALEYAKEFADVDMKNDILSQIAELYIKLEQYELASKYIQLPLTQIDSTNISALYNIASKIYRNIGKGDSATICYHKLLQYGNIYGKRNAHRELSVLAMQRGDVQAASEHFRQYKLLDDSIQKRDKAETVARMHAAYNYQKHKQKAVELELANAHQKNVMVLIIVFSLLLLGLLYALFRKRQQKLRTKMQRLQAITEDIRKRSSEYQETAISRISELNARIQELQTASQSANQRHQEEVLQLVAEKDQLEFQLKKQKIDEEVKITGMNAIKQSPAYKQFVKLDNQRTDIPNFADWAELQRYVNIFFPEFENRLKSLCKMTNQQYRACLLRWLGLGPSSTAFLTCYGKSSVSNLYMRLYENIMGKKGTMKDFDELLKGL